MTSVSFAYDLDKDLENFLKGLKSINSQVPTKLQGEFEMLHGTNYKEQEIKEFLSDRSNNINFEERIAVFESQWKPIEQTFVTRCEELFGIHIPDATTYLTQNQKCTYNWRENYFFVYYDAKFPNRTIMHELLHFYTHRKYDNLNIEPKRFNNIKESLTVILNTEFIDLMGEANDTGYPQHQEMRQEILNMRERAMPMDEIIRTLN